MDQYSHGLELCSHSHKILYIPSSNSSQQNTHQLIKGFNVRIGTECGFFSLYICINCFQKKKKSEFIKSSENSCIDSGLLCEKPVLKLKCEHISKLFDLHFLILIFNYGGTADTLLGQ